jgi:L-threonylcarbamoyladenylate synthase
MPTPILDDPAIAAAVLRDGGVVALPTETVYGLGADATNPRAVAKIFAAKQRPSFDPLIVHLAAYDQWPAVADDMPPLARRLAERFWPGPLTLVLPKRESISDLVTSGLPTVGVRVPRHPLMRRVLELVDRPIAAPSANLFGRLSPTTAAHVATQLGEVIDLILDGGPCAVGVESTIVRVDDDDRATVLRLGGLSLEELGSVVREVRLAPTESPTAPQAPGMLPQHYAPRTPITVVDRIGAPPLDERWGWLALLPIHADGYVLGEALSMTGDLLEAATRFFSALHRLDAAGLDRIIAVRFPETGLGRALNDRLQRAAATKPH